MSQTKTGEVYNLSSVQQTSLFSGFASRHLKLTNASSSWRALEKGPSCWKGKRHEMLHLLASSVWIGNNRICVCSLWNILQPKGKEKVTHKHSCCQEVPIDKLFCLCFKSTWTNMKRYAQVLRVSVIWDLPIEWFLCLKDEKRFPLFPPLFWERCELLNW